MTEIKRPLDGVKVVELSTFIAAPCCARYLSDLGAEVIKIEAPSGDPLRYTAVNEGRPFGDAEDTSFTLENSGKKCVTLNLKTDAGKAALEKLLGESHIFVTNWRQNALGRAGLDYETLKTKFPSLVMGLVSGYGEKGPDKDLPGFDFTAYFARGGVSGTMYDESAMPMLPVAGFGDHQVGMFLASGILAALYRAKETGQGDQVIVSLFHTAIWDVAIYLQSAQYGDPSTQYPISRKEIANQFQLSHRTKDNRWIQIAMPQYDKFYPIFMPILGREDLVGDERFFPQTNLQNNLDEFYSIVADGFAEKTLDEWIKILTEADIPYAVCQTWSEVLEDKQAWESDCLTEVEFPNGNKRTMVRPPVNFSETPLPEYNRAAFLGEDTENVLAELGYSSEQIQAMIEAGEAVGCNRIG